MVCIPGLFEVLGQKLLRHDRAGDARAGLLGKTGATGPDCSARGDGDGDLGWGGTYQIKFELVPQLCIPTSASPRASAVSIVRWGDGGPVEEDREGEVSGVGGNVGRCNNPDRCVRSNFQKSVTFDYVAATHQQRALIVY